MFFYTNSVIYHKPQLYDRTQEGMKKYMAFKLTSGSQQVFCLGTRYQMCSGLEAFHQKRIEAEENVGNSL